MRVVVGLGNPGERYAQTRHNIGFVVVDRLAGRWGIRFKPRPGLLVGKGRLGSEPLLLVKPLQYMNKSGDALAQLGVAWDPDELVIIHDDIDLAVGQLRVRHNGGSGGHRGVESFVARWGAGFDRVRVGVGRPTAGVDPADYVLSAPAASQRCLLGESVERACDAVECLLTDGLARAMSEFNGRAVGEG